MPLARMAPVGKLGSEHQDPGTDPDPVVKIHDIVIGHSDAAGGHGLTDRVRFIRAVDPVQRSAEIHGSCAERIVQATRHVARGRSGRRRSI